MKKVQHLITQKAVVGVAPSDPVLAAAQRMAEDRIGSVLVLDEAGHLAGIFTERDVMVRVVAAGKDPQTTTVGEVMTREVFTTTPDRGVVELRREMRARHIRHIPVVKKGSEERVLAVLGMRDLMRAALEEKREEVSEMTSYIRGEGA